VKCRQGAPLILADTFNSGSSWTEITDALREYLDKHFWARSDPQVATCSLKQLFPTAVLERTVARVLIIIFPQVVRVSDQLNSGNLYKQRLLVRYHVRAFPNFLYFIVRNR
jgi:hypothetical protein